MNTEAVDRKLAGAFRMAMQMRAEMRADGATDEECRVALEKILRANWPTLTPERDWPYWARVPRCIHCDGYGLVIRRVMNRLRLMVDEATPCTCHLGARYIQKPKSEQDFTEAGKTAKPKPQGFQRMGR